jgi:PPOX class probable F420-dependent enzyme
MKEMTAEERRAFLAHGTRTGKLATVRADGSPHAAPIWFVLDGDELVFMTWHDSVKARSILRDGRTTLVVDEAAFPYSFVMVEGTATVSDDAESRRRWARRIAERYSPTPARGGICGTERGRRRARRPRRAAPCRCSSRDGHLANTLKAAQRRFCRL